MVTIYPSKDEPITIEEGNNLTLSCIATGNGTLNYQWKRVSAKNAVITDITEEKNLTIHNIKVSESGQYYCEVDNGGASVSSTRVQVTVKSES